MILAPFARPARWLRLADPSWQDPLDPRFSAAHGGRWTPPGGEPTLYLCADRATARAIVARRFDNSPVRPEDLDDDQAPELVHLTINADIRAVDAVSDEGRAALGLPATYPLDAGGRLVEQARCQPIGKAAADAGHDGVYVRSAAITDGSGRELAWFPRGRRPDLRAREPYRRWTNR